MNQQEQMVFVIELCDTIRDHVVGLIAKGDIPRDWDGHELRELVYLTADQKRSAVLKRYRQRKDKFKNTCLINNLP